MARQSFSPREMDAASRVIQAENDLDKYVSAARGYANSINSEGTRAALLSYIDGDGGALDVLPVYEAEAFNKVHGRRIAGVRRSIERNREQAGGALALV
jgi:hypothetical protein